MAYEDIQRARTHWLFRTGLGLMAMVIGQNVYDPKAHGIADFLECLSSEADGTSPYIGCYLTTPADETPVFFVPYEQWVLGVYDRGLYSSQQSRPSFFTVLPNGNLSFFPNPDRLYTIRVPYRKVIDTMAFDADIPIIPEENQMLIVWWAVTNYYCTTRDGTRELKANASQQLRSAWHAITRDQLPVFTVGSGAYMSPGW
jgi:hypothetical protein